MKKKKYVNTILIIVITSPKKIIAKKTSCTTLTNVKIDKKNKAVETRRRHSNCHSV